MEPIEEGEAIQVGQGRNWTKPSLSVHEPSSVGSVSPWILFIFTVALVCTCYCLALVVYMFCQFIPPSAPNSLTGT